MASMLVMIKVRTDNWAMTVKMSDIGFSIFVIFVPDSGDGTGAIHGKLNYN
jgi:hypothetical protein